MTTATQANATASQIEEIARFASHTAEKAVWDYFDTQGLDGIQRVVERNDELARAIREAILASFDNLSVSDKFKNDEVSSNFGYFSGYMKPKSIAEQCNILRQIFPGIGNACEKIAEGELPGHAEGWFAIPKWQTIAPTYGEAVEKVLDAIRKARNGKFHNYREGQLGPDRLRQTARSVSMSQKLADEQKGHDILVVPAQFGIRHRGRSVRRAREVMQANECGLGAFAIGIMLLTHPERLSHYDDLWIDCTGDEYALGAAGDFSDVPFYVFGDGHVGFAHRWVGRAHARDGSASAFIPQP